MTIGKFLFISVVVAVAAYLTLIFHPEFLFKASHQEGDLIIHSAAPLEPRHHELFARVKARAAEGVPLNNGHIDIFLVGDVNKYNLLAPLWRNSYSSFNPLTGHILVALPDLELLQVSDPAGAQPPRSLEGLLVHEVVKAHLKIKLSFLTYIMLPELKKEGFAETVAMETGGMDPLEICPSKDNGSLLTRYLKYRLILEALAFENDMTRIDLLKSTRGDEAGVKRAIQKHCGQN